MRNRISAGCALALLCVFLASCSGNPVRVKPSNIIKYEIVDLMTGAMLDIDTEGPDMEIVRKILTQCEQEFHSDGACTGEDGHLYQMICYSAEFIEVDITINADGSFCSARKHYVPVSSSDRVQVELLEPLFPEIEKRDSNKPYETDEMVLDQGSQTLIEHDGWTYSSEHALLEGRPQTVLCRTNGSRTEVVFSVYESYGNRYTKSVEYVQYSLETSGESALYFTVFDSETKTRGLFVFNLSSETWEKISSEPCSNLVIFYDEDSEDQDNIGWIVSGATLKALRLSSGVSEDAVYYASDLGGLSASEGKFFYDAYSTFDNLYTELSSESGHILLIRITMEKGGEETNTSVRFDCDKRELIVEEPAEEETEDE